AREVSAFRNMEVWDAGGAGVVRFDCAELGEPCLGYIIEPEVILAALLDRLLQLDNVSLFQPARFRAMRVNGSQVEVDIEGARTLTAKLVIAADGVRSPVREALGIETRFHDYAQSSVVALVRTEASHQATAWQRFLPGGPLAFLPLNGGWCSIVWTLPGAEAERVLGLDREAFHDALGSASGYRLGRIMDSGRRESWPLQRMHAQRYVGERVALIGDAAHAIHPLAGQGVNLGLLDAAALAEVIIDAANSGRDPGVRSILRRYERWRRGDNLLMMSAMDGFNRLFSNAVPPLQRLRNLGLSLANRAAPARHVLMRHAMGLSGDLPRLARAPESA
ncbi:MAG: UbiH/UbiF/VisC/COQ6 family ubiquinone biosynthesis hydroxylase, partial [Gammaproteobacteria bacterium]